MLPFRELSDQFSLVFYDHRCNGRSVGAPVTSMTWENLTADAEALREKLGFARWAVLGHWRDGRPGVRAPVPAELAAGIPNARLEIIERAGHNAQAERPDEVLQAVRDFQ
jgi:pimeloyl-ACP methyl ester carboxylesterase